MRWREITPVLSLMLLAVAVRALGFEFVFVDGEVYFPAADPQYHVRRAFYTFANFPSVLLFDSYINYPGGAPVPWPPLFDFLGGSLARLLAHDRHGFEIVMAWLGPLFASLAILPIYLVGRRLDSPALGLLAALFLVLLPTGVGVSRVGYADHHAAVAMIGAWLFYSCTLAVDAGEDRRRVTRSIWIGIVARLALLLTWHGSLLYLALCEGSLLLAGLAMRQSRLPAIQAITGLGTIACLIPILIASPTPLGGPFSSIALSWLQVLAMLAVVIASGGLYLLERVAPSPSLPVRVVCVLGSLVLLVGFLWSIPGTRAGLQPAIDFLSMSDAMGSVTLEQGPLFDLFGRQARVPARLSWGYYAYFIPVIPAAALFLPAFREGGSGRILAVMLAGWGAFFGSLTVFQLRYGNDYSAAGSLLFAAALMAISRRVIGLLPKGATHPRSVATAAVVLCIALFAPPIRQIYLPGAVASIAALGGASNPLARTSVFATLNQFAARVRELTPDTQGYASDEGEPEYGILTHANIGHALHNVARRATATDPFWSYIGEENWARSMAFLSQPRERDALLIAERLKGRYVITMPTEARGSIVAQLHALDGRDAGGRPRLEHFRLIAEAPSTGTPLHGLHHPTRPGEIAYKLFEIVAGATLEVRTTAGQRVSASIDVRTNQGREFTYHAMTNASRSGIAIFGLPYASELPEGDAGETMAQLGVTPRGAYRVVSGDRTLNVAISDAAVRTGERVFVTMIDN